MKYCYIDESGNPSPKNKKPFIVAMVVIDSMEDVLTIEEKLEELKRANGITRDYEFHYSRNTAKRRNIFIDFIAHNIKKFVAFVIKKNKGCDVLAEAADLISCYLDRKEKYRIKLDTNPHLFKELKMALKQQGIIAKTSQVKSSNNSLIQVADYVAGATSDGLKIREAPLKGELLR